MMAEYSCCRAAAAEEAKVKIKSKIKIKYVATLNASEGRNRLDGKY